MKRHIIWGVILSCEIMLVVAIVWGASLTVQVPPGPYPGTVASGDLDITWSPASATTDSFAATGKELILAKNTSASAVASVTLYSQPDQYRRSADIVYSVTPSGTIGFWAGGTVGWKDATGEITIEANTTAVKWAILRIQ